MRAIGLIGLVLALLVVGILVKRQVGTPMAVVPSLPAPTATDGAVPTVQGPSRQLQQDIQKSLDAAMQPRAMPEEAN